MMAVPVRTSPDLTLGDPVMLFENRGYQPLVPPAASEAAGRGWDVASDGRFLMAKAEPSDDSQQPRIVFVQNWFEELKRLVPTP